MEAGIIFFEVVEDFVEVVPVLGLIQEFEGSQDCIFAFYVMDPMGFPIFDLIYEVSRVCYNYLLVFEPVQLSYGHLFWIKEDCTPWPGPGVLVWYVD